SRSLATRAPGGAMVRGLASAVLATASLLGRQSSPGLVQQASPAVAVRLAPAGPVAPAPPPTYTVVRGDNLWSVAEDHLGDALAWRDIWEANRDRDMGEGEVFSDPSLIQPGWILELPTAARPAPLPPAPLSPTPSPAAPAATAGPTPMPTEPVPTTSPVRTAPAPSPPVAASTGHHLVHTVRSPSRDEAGVVVEAVAGLGLGGVGIGLALAKTARVRARRRRAGNRIAPLPEGTSAIASALIPAEEEDPAAWVRAGLRLAADVARGAGVVAV